MFGNGTIFLPDTVFIAQSKISTLLFTNSHCLLPMDSNVVLLLICSLVNSLKLCFQCSRLFNQSLSLDNKIAFITLSLSSNVFNKLASCMLVSVQMATSLTLITSLHSVSLFSNSSLHSKSFFLITSSKY